MVMMFNYIGYIGEVLAYDAALEPADLSNMIDAMITKWTTGLTWENVKFSDTNST